MAGACLPLCVSSRVDGTDVNGLPPFSRPPSTTRAPVDSFPAAVSTHTESTGNRLQFAHPLCHDPYRCVTHVYFLHVSWCGVWDRLETDF